MFVESARNFEVLRDLNFTLFGMGPKYRRRAERMKPNDQVLFYVSGLRIWPATATVASTYFEDDTPLWEPTTRNESFRYRIKLNPDIVLEEDDYIDALVLGPRLDYVKRWAPQDWPLAFWDRLHLLSQRDFRLIESEMQRAAARHRRSNRPHDQDRDQRSDFQESNGHQIDDQDDDGITNFADEDFGPPVEDADDQSEELIYVGAVDDDITSNLEGVDEEPAAYEETVASPVDDALIDDDVAAVQEGEPDPETSMPDAPVSESLDSPSDEIGDVGAANAQAGDSDELPIDDTFVSEGVAAVHEGEADTETSMAEASVSESLDSPSSSDADLADSEAPDDDTDKQPNEDQG